MPPIVELKGVDKNYGARRALDGISFALNAAEFTVLLGPNGAGKTTLFNILAGLDYADGGVVSVLGTPLVGDSPAIRKQIGLVFQESTLDRELTVLQNLRYFAGLFGIADSEEVITHWLDTLDIADRARDPVVKLNGGHKRRVELVRAMLAKPKVLLLDEPTVGLDPVAANMMIARVRELANDGVCALWITHLLDELDANDRVIFLREGRVECDDVFANYGSRAKLVERYRSTDRMAL